MNKQWLPSRQREAAQNEAAPNGAALSASSWIWLIVSGIATLAWLIGICWAVVELVRFLPN
jgi:hypothetical protein